MKKILYLSLIISLVFSTSSCLFDDEQVFDESSAKRKNDFMEEAKQALVAEENGWVMYYFPDQNSQGVTFLMKFYENGNAIIATANEYTKNAFAISDGLWEVLGDNGPVLSFNTYIDIFTMFADPVAPTTAGEGGTGGPGGDGTGSTQTSDGVGLNGDYEFNIQSLENGIINLKGKKRGTRILMQKSPVQFNEGNDQTWRNYLEERDKDRKTTFFSGSPILHLHLGDSIYKFSNAGSGVFSILNSKAALDAVPVSLPFVMLPDGMRFSRYYEEDDFSFIQMKFDETRQELFDPLNKDTKLVPESTYSYLPTSSDYYYGNINSGQISGGLLTAFEKVAKESFEKNSMEGNPLKVLHRLGFKFDPEINKVYMVIQSGVGSNLAFPIVAEMSKEKNIFNVGPFDVNALVLNDSIAHEKNALAIYQGVGSIQKIESVRELLQEIQGEYKVTTEVPFTMDKVKYIKVDDESDMLEIERSRNI